MSAHPALMATVVRSVHGIERLEVIEPESVHVAAWLKNRFPKITLEEPKLAAFFQLARTGVTTASSAAELLAALLVRSWYDPAATAHSHCAHFGCRLRFDMVKERYHIFLDLRCLHYPFISFVD